MGDRSGPILDFGGKGLEYDQPINSVQDSRQLNEVEPADLRISHNRKFFSDLRSGIAFSIEDRL